MNHLDNFFGYFNIILGIVFILIGLKIYRPFKKDKDREELLYRKYMNFFRFGGLGLVIWGITKLL